jgi:bacillithiol synthase
MLVHRIPYTNVPQLSKTDRAYATQADVLKPFYKYTPHLDAFEQVINDKKQDKTDRISLVKVLKEQYSAAHHPNIDALAKSNTFTVTTAHQPSLFLGPLYFVYKIFSTINLAEALQQKYPAYHFVPVFVIWGEDHDFEEINHIHLFNKKITWQHTEKGAVGNMHTHSLAQPLAELKEILGESDSAQHIFARIEQAYTQHDLYADATQALLKDLFGKYGLIILNMNHPTLKRLFASIIEQELVSQPSKPLVEYTVQQLNEIGFKNQAFPREINLFYMRDGLRERIVAENDLYKVINTDISFTKEAILQELSAHPEYFSPNVVLRPIYQEKILPNLAYIGGGGELAYWLERKQQFEHFGVNFPMLVRRNSALWLDEESMKKWRERFGFTVEDLFQPVGTLVQRYIQDNTHTDIHFEQQKKELTATFEEIINMSKEIDATLEKPAVAERIKTLQSIEGLEARLKKALKQKHEVGISQMSGIKHRFFPEEGLQERQQNFLQLYLKHGDIFFDILKRHLHTLPSEFLVFESNMTI